MRIITGTYKGRVIKMPKGIRPTPNRVRKAVFDILGDIEGLSFLELFAGSGAVGLEALSQGARDVTLVESNSNCVSTIRENIGHLAVSDCELIAMDVEKALEIFKRGKIKFEIIFLDPPYYLGMAKKTLQSIYACDILAPTGFVIVQHFKRDELPPEEGDLSLFKRSVYGDTLLSFYKKGKQD